MTYGIDPPLRGALVDNIEFVLHIFIEMRVESRPVLAAENVSASAAFTDHGVGLLSVHAGRRPHGFGVEHSSRTYMSLHSRERTNDGYGRL